jgi:dTDP-4-dehydrorhamnose 3,5-epimerase
VRYHPAPLQGAYVVEVEPVVDDRGFFARLWCADEARQVGLVPEVVQCSLSYNQRRGTVRGLHFQAPPFAETKLVRCVRGALFDVLVDLRRESHTYGRWFAVELTAGNHKATYIPAGFAHGLQTLEDDSEVLYQMSTPYCPEASRGVRWDDPTLNIPWPLPPAAISLQDTRWPSLEELGVSFNAGGDLAGGRH